MPYPDSRVHSAFVVVDSRVRLPRVRGDCHTCSCSNFGRTEIRSGIKH